MAENTSAFEGWLNIRDRVIYDRYQAQSLVGNGQSKLQKEWRTGAVESDFEGNKNMF